MRNCFSRAVTVGYLCDKYSKARDAVSRCEKTDAISLCMLPLGLVLGAAGAYQDFGGHLFSETTAHGMEGAGLAAIALAALCHAWLPSVKEKKEIALGDWHDRLVQTNAVSWQAANDSFSTSFDHDAMRKTEARIAEINIVPVPKSPFHAKMLVNMR